MFTNKNKITDCCYFMCSDVYAAAFRMWCRKKTSNGLLKILLKMLKRLRLLWSSFAAQHPISQNILPFLADELAEKSDDESS